MIYIRYIKTNNFGNNIIHISKCDLVQTCFLIARAGNNILLIARNITTKHWWSFFRLEKRKKLINHQNNQQQKNHVCWVFQEFNNSCQWGHGNYASKQKKKISPLTTLGKKFKFNFDSSCLSNYFKWEIFPVSTLLSVFRHWIWTFLESELINWYQTWFFQVEKNRSPYQKGSLFLTKNVKKM